MSLFKNPEIDKNPLVQCIKQTDILCDTNKKILYKELGTSGFSRFKNIIIKNINLPSQDNEIRELFEIVLPYNENEVNNLMKEYTTIKNITSL